MWSRSCGLTEGRKRLSAKVCLLPQKSAKPLRCCWPEELFSEQRVRVGRRESRLFKTCDLFYSLPRHTWLNISTPALAWISNCHVWLSHSESFVPRKYGIRKPDWADSRIWHLNLRARVLYNNTCIQKKYEMSEFRECSILTCVYVCERIDTYSLWSEYP